MRRIIGFLQIGAYLFCFSSLTAQTGDRAAAGITIPVVVHILSADANEGITDDRIREQIEALNRDFNARNSDLRLVPAAFKESIANCQISFELATVDPAGMPSTGILHKQTSIRYFNLDNRAKFSNRGGDDAWPREHYLNIWVCDLIGGISGYSSTLNDAAELDGVVISSDVFGWANTKADHGLGRIAVHEVGHWLGLKHIWGDAHCGDDGIDDTPQQQSYHLGCPQGIVSSCGNNRTGDMYMNYMDRTNDACMYLFTKGQSAKMRSLFQPGQLRYSLLQAAGLGKTGSAPDLNWTLTHNTSAEPKITLTCFPVPAVHELKISIEGNQAGHQQNLVFYNIMGQAIMSLSMTGNTTTADISALKSGQYIIRAAGAKAARFVKL